MGKVVYTVITSKKYSLPPIEMKTPGWDFVCFSSRALKSKQWDIVRFRDDLDSQRLSRKPKILYHRYVGDYDMSLFLDSKFVVRIDLDEFVQRLGTADMAVMSHNKRSCIYQEAQKLQKLKLDDPILIQDQVQKYRSQGFPDNNGLYAPGITLRKHGSVELEKCMDIWFDEVKNHSYRDILSLPYAIWKAPIKLTTIPWKEVYPLFRPR